MATGKRIRHYRRRAALALSGVAITAGLALAGGALSSATAFAGETQTAAKDDIVRPLAISGPYVDFYQCNQDRMAADLIYESTTPCFQDPQGWFFQYF